jgi:hypothetical protein
MVNEYARLKSQLNIVKLCACKTGYMDNENCSWYHRNWMLLRQLDIVSNPFWHENFYKQHLNEYISRPDLKVLVLGTADFTMPYLCHQIGINKLYISDVCQTPLNICSAIAEIEGYDWNIFACDIRKGMPTQYDLIVNDAFFTRFDYPEKSAILFQIRQSLNPGGKYITTIRKGWNNGKPLVPSESEKESFVRKAIRIAKDRLQENTELAARQYIEKMTSYPMKDEDALVSLCNNLFSIEHISSVDVPGECIKSTYFEVVLKLKK